MKRTSLFLLFLLVLASLAGFLLSKASLVGKVGISVFYRQYQFLKTWWQGGLLLFFVWMILFFLERRAQRQMPPRSARLVHLGVVVVSLVGLYFTYLDFRNTLSHRWLGERFHLGGYLFWIGCISVPLFFLTDRKKDSEAIVSEEKQAATITSETNN